MRDLIERLERTLGPNEELNRLIHIAIDGNTVVPNYTGSMDAAMKLIPNLHDWSVASDLDGFGGGFYLAHCHPATASGTFEPSTGDTAPIALCIAALEARAAVA